MRCNKTLFLQYCKILDDYLDKKLTDLVPNSEKTDDKPAFYLLHHTVLRQDSIYTKCQIVFDASAHDDKWLFSLHFWKSLSKKMIEMFYNFFLLPAILLIMKISRPYVTGSGA